MISGLRSLVGAESPRLRTQYLVALALYAVSEGVAFGLLVPLLTDLLAGRVGRAAWWLLPLGGVAAFGWVTQYQVGLRALHLASRWRQALYERIGDQLMRLPLGWYDGPDAGRVPQLVGSDVTRIAGSVYAFPAAIAAVLTPGTTLVFVLCFDWRIGLTALVAVPVVLTALFTGRRVTESTEAAHHEASAEAGRRLVEFAGAQPTLRAAGQAASGRRDLDAALHTQYRAARRQVLRSLPNQNLGPLGVQAAVTALIAVGVVLAVHHRLDAPAMTALVVAGVSLLRPFEDLVGAVAALRVCAAAARRVGALLAVAALPEPTRPSRPVGNQVDLVDVEFAYPGGPPVLRGVSLSLPPGTTTALVGVSGAGKTTVTKLIARFHDVTGGEVRIGGVDVRDMASADVLDTVAVVFQDVYLLDATIEDNIRFANPGASTERIRDAARRARVDQIVARLPDGWASRVGEGGRLLSGGERQRVAIARALCKDAPVVLLDEATSSLDAENEAAVQAALRELAAGRTLLVIAHRLSTITHADRIAVLDEGRVAESGDHAQLLAAGGRYARLWDERRRAGGWQLRAPAEGGFRTDANQG